MGMLGIDIGGSGIKGAPVDLETGSLMGERFRVETPEPATPEAVIEAIARVVDNFSWVGPMGCTFPGVVRGGRIETAVNLNPKWVGMEAEQVLSQRFGQPVTMLNDADAAAVAEVRYGAARSQRGLVIMVTLGTGIGTGLIYDGVLIPNAELGHLEIDGKEAEARASNAARERHSLSWKKWSRRVSAYLSHLERLFSPDLFVIGGGVVKDADRFLPRLGVCTPVVQATLGNLAGIVGAALACSQAHPAAAAAPAAAPLDMRPRRARRRETT